MTRVLIISYYFAPQNLIGAVRPTKLAKYLSRTGCEVTVLCGAGMNPDRLDPTLARDLRELKDVRVIREWNPLRDYKARKSARQSAAGGASGGAAAPAGERKGWKARALDAVYMALWRLSDLSFQRRAKRALRGLDGTYDAVFSSYAPLSVHEVARAAKRMGLAKRWIADFRDEAIVPFGWMEGYKRRYLRMVARESDLVTAASQGLLDMMGLEGRVLNNGFDRSDLPDAVEKGDGGRFRTVYCGQLGMNRRGMAARDLTPCFHALRALMDEGLLGMDELSLVYAGGEGALYRRQAEATGLAGCVTDLGSVSRERSLALQAGADLLLMASVNDANCYGILTGKLFEYLMADKPILCCMSGEQAHSALKRVLTETGAGFCWEAANAAEDSPALQGYLRDIICAWRQELPSPVPKNIQQIESYAYPNLTATLLDWIRQQ